MNHVNLIGADDVARAGYAMRDAAESIGRSVGYLEQALQLDHTRRVEADELEHKRRTEALEAFAGLVERLERVVKETQDLLGTED